jgi:hypothetical protein
LFARVCGVELSLLAVFMFKSSRLLVGGDRAANVLMALARLASCLGLRAHTDISGGSATKTRCTISCMRDTHSPRNGTQCYVFKTREQQQQQQQQQQRTGTLEHAVHQQVYIE